MGELLQFKGTYEPPKIQVALRRWGITKTPKELPEKVTPIDRPKPVIVLNDIA